MLRSTVGLETTGSISREAWSIWPRRCYSLSGRIEVCASRNRASSEGFHDRRLIGLDGRPGKATVYPIILENPRKRTDLILAPHPIDFEVRLRRIRIYPIRASVGIVDLLDGVFANIAIADAIPKRWRRDITTFAQSH
jgi:hypothetical protein